jgi:hypothetical protein
MLCPFKAERKRYEKETEKYYSSLEKLLNMSAKKKELQLQEVLCLIILLSLSCVYIYGKQAEKTGPIIFPTPKWLERIFA